MWRQLAGIADGLHCFHTLPVKRAVVNVPLPAQDSSILQVAEEEEKYYCHSDLKPANILICDGVFKIADFGSCFRGWTEFRCTLSYSAPECDLRFQEPSLGSPYDIWSFGGILSEVVAWILGGPREVEGFRIERYVAPVFPSL